MIDTCISPYIAALADYGVRRGLLESGDRTWAINRLLAVLKLDEYEEPETPVEAPLEELLGALVDFSVKRGDIQGDVTSRDLLDTELMGVLTPRPSWVIDQFRARESRDKKSATDWYYTFSQDTDYIREGCEVGYRDGVRRSGHHHQPV